MTHFVPPNAAEIEDNTNELSSVSSGASRQQYHHLDGTSGLFSAGFGAGGASL